MKIPSITKHSTRSGVLLGGFLFLFAGLPGAAHADGWGFSINVPFLGIGVGGPYGHYHYGAYDYCGCPGYYYSPSGYAHPYGWPPPGEVDVNEDVYDERSDASDRPRLEVESRSSRSEPPEQSRIPARTDSDEYSDPQASLEVERDDRIGMIDRNEATDNPNLVSEDGVEESFEPESGAEPSEATTVEEGTSEEREELIPLSGVN